MKTKMNVLITIIILALAICLTSCVDGDAGSSYTHTHTYYNIWSSDKYEHWHEDTCGHNTKSDIAMHTWDSGRVSMAATESQSGIMTYTCSVCGMTKNELIPKLSHVHTYASVWTWDDNYHWYAANCGHNVTKDKSVHTWDSGTVTKQATSANSGILTYTCTVCARTKIETIEPDYSLDFVFVEYGRGYAITNYIGTSSVVTVPAYYNGRPVVAIGIYADNDNPTSYDLVQNAGFYKNSLITKVILPETITVIGRSAFNGCSNLNEINIPVGCQYIYKCAFQDTALDKITLPNSLVYISNQFVFRNVQLESITFAGKWSFNSESIAQLFDQQRQEFTITKDILDKQFKEEDDVNQTTGGTVNYSLRDGQRWFVKDDVQYFMYDYTITTKTVTNKLYSMTGHYITVTEYVPTKIKGLCYVLPISLKTVYVDSLSTGIELLKGNSSQYEVMINGGR